MSTDTKQLFECQIDGDCIEYTVDNLLMKIVSINGQEPSLGFSDETNLIGKIYATHFRGKGQ